jgi:hypothetical protein
VRASAEKKVATEAVAGVWCGKVVKVKNRVSKKYLATSDSDHIKGNDITVPGKFYSNMNLKVSTPA